MIGEDRILAAFWNRNQGRFCELMDHEVKYRAGISMTSDPAKTLLADGVIAVDQKDTHRGRIYRLTRKGEARVTAMIVMGTLPKPIYRLTAIPPEQKKGRA